MGFKQSEALKTIERLDLWNEQAGWEIHTLSTFNNEMTKQLRPKGCFVMYNLDEFDFSAIAQIDPHFEQPHSGATLRLSRINKRPLLMP